MFVEGTSVSYKGISGTIAFYSKKYISILIKKGNHRAQDVKIVVYQSNFNLIQRE